VRSWTSQSAAAPKPLGPTPSPPSTSAVMPTVAPTLLGPPAASLDSGSTVGELDLAPSPSCSLPTPKAVAVVLGPTEAAGPSSNKLRDASDWLQAGVPRTRSSLAPEGLAGVLSSPVGVLSGAVGVLSGPAGVLSGPAGVLSGPAGVLSGPAGVLSGSAGVLPGPAGVLSGPVKVLSGPAGVLASPVGVLSGPVGAKLP